MESRLLLIGFGNPARRDDGLGPAFAERVAGLHFPGVEVDSNYQLAAEDAEAMSRHPVVVLVDAAASGDAPFTFTRVEPEPESSFSTHSLSPGSLLALVREAFGKQPDCWLLGIRGYEFEHFSEGLTEKAGENLEQALHFFQEWMRNCLPPTPNTCL